MLPDDRALAVVVAALFWVEMTVLGNASVSSMVTPLRALLQNSFRCDAVLVERLETTERSTTVRATCTALKPYEALGPEFGTP